MSEQFSYLDSAQRESLKGLPFAVLLPTEIQADWAVRAISFEEDEEDGASFSLSIGKEDGATLTFLATNGSIGDPVGGARSSKHTHPELGEIAIEHEEDGDFLSDWLEFDNGFSAIGGRGVSNEEIDFHIARLAVK